MTGEIASLPRSSGCRGPADGGRYGHAHAQRRGTGGRRHRAGVRRPGGEARRPRLGARQRLPREADRADEAARLFGLAIPEPWGEAPVSMPCYALVTAELARGWMSLAGAMGGHTVVAKLLAPFGTDEQKDRYLPRMATGEVRATMALTEPGGGSDLQTWRPPPAATATATSSTGQDVDHQRPPLRAHRAAVQDRPGRPAAAPGHLDPARRARAGAHRLEGPAQARLQGRRELRAAVRRPAVRRRRRARRLPGPRASRR